MPNSIETGPILCHFRATFLHKIELLEKHVEVGNRLTFYDYLAQHQMLGEVEMNLKVNDPSALENSLKAQAIVAGGYFASFVAETLRKPTSSKSGSATGENIAGNCGINRWFSSEMQKPS